MLPSSGIVPFHSEPDSISFGFGLRGFLGSHGSGVTERARLRRWPMKVSCFDFKRRFHSVYIMCIMSDDMLQDRG